MSEEFKPKISYRIAGMYMHKPTTPWEYVENWAMSDRGPDETLEKLNERMQNRWPGKYKIVAVLNDKHQWLEYKFKFFVPSEETMFKLRWA